MRVSPLPRATIIAGSIASSVYVHAGDLSKDASINSELSDIGAVAAAEPFRLDFGMLQDQPASLPDEPEDDWRVDATAYIWLTAMSGDVRTGPFSAEVDASFGDLVDASDSILAFSGRLEVGKGRWAGFIEGIASTIGADDQTGPVGLASVDLTTDMLLLDFGVMYRVCDKPATNGGGRNHMLDLYIGGRYQDLEVELDPAVLAARTASKDWIDPIIGARSTLQLHEQWDLTLAGDIGGFGVGSDLTWSLSGVVGFHFEMFNIPTTAYAGYRALGTDYSEGSGVNRFEWDMILHGPVLGLTLSF